MNFSKRTGLCTQSFLRLRSFTRSNMWPTRASRSDDSEASAVVHSHSLCTQPDRSLDINLAASSINLNRVVPHCRFVA